MKEIAVKYAGRDIIKELNNIGFDSSYIESAEKKYKAELYKIFNLKTPGANILKQLCLASGFDCAVSRDTVTCGSETTDCIVLASVSQIEKLIPKLSVQPFGLKQLAKEFNEIINGRLAELKLKSVTFDYSRPYIAGILNVTPDSFSDGGKYFDINAALNKAKEMINDGADIIDIGGESTRPGAKYVSPDEEMSRVIPVIEKIRNSGIDTPVSIDTRNFQTAKAAIESGADIINDVSGLDYDSNLFKYVTENNIPVIIMHSNKVPAIASDFTSQDIIEEIYFDFRKKIKMLTDAGVSKGNIILDPGIGFGKTKESCFEILQRIDEFKTLNVPLFLGISRKSFICREFNIETSSADMPTALYSAMLKGINIHRVHNVRITKMFLDYAKKL